jgi:hypothetical protein
MRLPRRLFPSLLCLLVCLPSAFPQSRKDADPKLGDFVGKWTRDINGNNAFTLKLALSPDGQSIVGELAHFAVYSTHDGKTFNDVESVSRAQDHDKIIHASLRNGVLHIVCKTPDGDPVFWQIVLHGNSEADLLMEGREDDPRTTLKSWELHRVR